MSGREVSGSIFLGDLGGTIRGGNVRAGLFPRRELSERELSLRRSCPGGGTVRG